MWSNVILILYFVAAPTVEETLYTAVKDIEIMSDIDCSHDFYTDGNMCYKQYSTQPAADLSTAQQLCIQAQAQLAEFRISNDNVEVLIELSRSAPIWLNLQVDYNLERFIWVSDQTYLHPALNNPLWHKTVFFLISQFKFVHIFIYFSEFRLWVVLF